MFKNSISFSIPVQVILTVLLVLALASANPEFTILALLFPPFAAKLVWKKNEPPVLFLGFIFQWLQVSIKVFYADLIDARFETVNLYPLNINASFLLCLMGLFIQCVGIAVVTGKFVSPPVSRLNTLINGYSLNKITTLYILFSVLMPVVLQYSPGGFAQFSYKFADFKWAIFFVFYCATFLKGEKTYVFYLIISIEIILGFTGYFSGFKDFFLFVAICYLTIRQRMSTSQYITLIVAAAILFNVMIVWQTVKGDYRTYLNGGQHAQVVTVTKRQALNVLYFKVSNLGKEDYKHGMDQLVSRISYIDFFSAVMAYVPKSLPYEGGRLWSDAVTRIFTPRILFPNKAVIDDSEKTRKYTGLSYAGASEGTSISIGYITESYVDFGPVFMFVPLLFFGMLIGWIYKYILTHSYNQFLGYACTIPLFFQLYTFELALDKAIGALIAFFLVYLLIRRFFIRPAERYILNTASPKHEYSPGQPLV